MENKLKIMKSKEIKVITSEKGIKLLEKALSKEKQKEIKGGIVIMDAEVV